MHIRNFLIPTVEYLFYLFLQHYLEDLGFIDICIIVQMQEKNVKQNNVFGGL